MMFIIPDWLPGSALVGLLALAILLVLILPEPVLEECDHE